MCWVLKLISLNIHFNAQKLLQLLLYAKLRQAALVFNGRSGSRIHFRFSVSGSADLNRSTCSGDYLGNVFFRSDRCSKVGKKLSTNKSRIDRCNSSTLVVIECTELLLVPLDIGISSVEAAILDFLYPVICKCSAVALSRVLRTALVPYGNMETSTPYSSETSQVITMNLCMFHYVYETNT